MPARRVVVRTPPPPTAQLDTERVGTAIRNLTQWTDLHASGTAFAVGNAAFAMVFIGRRAVLLLWLAFIAAFAAPKRHDLLEWASSSDSLASSAVEACASAVDMIKSAVEGVVATVRARLDRPSADAE